MILGKKVLVIIPARSGSQRVKNKNLKLVNGKPLIHDTLQYAKRNLGSVDRIIVSTDSLKIQSYVNKFGDYLANKFKKNNIYFVVSSNENFKGNNIITCDTEKNGSWNDASLWSEAINSIKLMNNL